jgi:hypothetical protein
MSPEQARLSALDHRSDLFSLGSVLYHMCTGELPFPGPTLKATLTGVREAEARPIRDLNADIPPALEDLIRRLMAKDPAERCSSARELVHVLADELAKIQGRGSRPLADHREQESQSPDSAGAAWHDGQLDLVDSWDDAGPIPRPKKGAATATRPPLALSIARGALVVIGAAAVIAIVALALISSLPTWWREFGKDTPSILLLAFTTGIAVCTWSLAQLVTAVRHRAAAGSAKRPRVGFLRNVLATTMLLPTASTAYLEFSAHAQCRSAVNALNARQLKWNTAAPTRQEVETLIGRTAEDLPTGTEPRPFEVTYRWKGVFRTYVLRAKYLRPRHNVRDPRAEPSPGEEGFDTLYSISDVLE